MTTGTARGRRCPCALLFMIIAWFSLMQSEAYSEQQSEHPLVLVQQTRMPAGVGANARVLRTDRGLLVLSSSGLLDLTRGTHRFIQRLGSFNTGAEGAFVAVDETEASYLWSFQVGRVVAGQIASDGELQLRRLPIADDGKVTLFAASMSARTYYVAYGSERYRNRLRLDVFEQAADRARASTEMAFAPRRPFAVKAALTDDEVQVLFAHSSRHEGCNGVAIRLETFDPMSLAHRRRTSGCLAGIGTASRELHVHPAVGGWYVASADRGVLRIWRVNIGAAGMFAATQLIEQQARHWSRATTVFDAASRRLIVAPSTVSASAPIPLVWIEAEGHARSGALEFSCEDAAPRGWIRTIASGDGEANLLAYARAGGGVCANVWTVGQPGR